MKRLTTILAHKDYENSIANKTIIEALEKHFPDMSLRHLMDLYPTYAIDIEREQENLRASDIILLQFPIYWYNMPAILKKWFDDVLAYGFAYGEGGDGVMGKQLLISCTAGGSEQSYTPIGHMHFHLRPLLNNIESATYYCRMKFEEPVIGYGNIYIPGVANTPEIVKSRALEQSERLIKKLEELLSE